MALRTGWDGLKFVCAKVVGGGWKSSIFIVIPEKFYDPIYTKFRK